MARLLFGGDDVDVRGPYGAAVLSASGRTGIVYLDAAGTTLADIVTYPAGAAIAGSVITVSPDSQLPLFQGPADGTDTLYVSVDGHAPAPIYTNVDARLDLLATNVAGRLNWRGAWAATTAYATNDLVTFNGGLYRAPNNFTSAGAFVLANWVELHPQIGTYVSRSGTAWADTSGAVTFVWQPDPDAAAGVGLRVDRTAGANKYPSLIFSIDGTSQFGMAGMDTTVANGILAYDYLIPQSAGTKSGDVFRFSHGAHFLMGDGVGAPSSATRLNLVSTSTDDPATRTMLKIDINTGSPVTKFVQATVGASTVVWEVNVVGTSVSASLGRSFAGTAGTTGMEVTNAVLVFNTDADPKVWLSRRGTSSADWYWRIDNAASGAKLNRATLRYNNGGFDAIQAYTAGGIGFGSGSALATTATDGFVHLPNMAGTPTGVPTAYDTRSPIVVDTTGSKLWAYIGGAWKSVTLA